MIFISIDLISAFGTYLFQIFRKQQKERRKQGEAVIQKLNFNSGQKKLIFF